MLDHGTAAPDFDLPDQAWQPGDRRTLGLE
jgi:hypothetical protein